MQALMEGRVKLQGDLTKLMAAQARRRRARARPGSPRRSPRSRPDRRRAPRHATAGRAPSPATARVDRPSAPRPWAGSTDAAPVPRGRALRAPDAPSLRVAVDACRTPFSAARACAVDACSRGRPPPLPVAGRQRRDAAMCHTRQKVSVTLVPFGTFVPAGRVAGRAPPARAGSSSRVDLEARGPATAPARPRATCRRGRRHLDQLRPLAHHDADRESRGAERPGRRDRCGSPCRSSTVVAELVDARHA